MNCNDIIVFFDKNTKNMQNDSRSLVQRLYSYFGFIVFWTIALILVWVIISPFTLIDKLTNGAYSFYTQVDYINELNTK